MILFIIAIAHIRGANVYPVKSGDWSADIWSDNSTGEITPGMRPSLGDFDVVHMRKGGLAVTVSQDAGSIRQLFLNNRSGVNILALKSGARLSAGIVNNASGGGRSVIKIEKGAVLEAGKEGVRVSNGDKTIGTIVIDGGSLKSAGLIRVAGRATAIATLELKDGIIEAPSLETAREGKSVFSWTGGVLAVNYSDLPELANNGAGILEIGGARRGGIGLFQHRGTGGIFRQGAGATLRVDIKSAKGYDRFLAIGTGNAVVLNGTLEVFLADNYKPASGVVFDVVVAESITDEGIRLGGAAAGLFKTGIAPDKQGRNVFQLTVK